MSDLRKLLKEEYRKKKTTVNPQSLMEMIEEMMDTPVEALTEAERFSMSIPIPKLTPNEAWGDPKSQSRKDIDRIFASITKQPSIQARIAHVNSFVDPTLAKRKGTGMRFNAILNMMMIIEALQACLNDYSESSAGFVFEGFMAALTGGRQIAGRVGGTLPIEDFVTGDEDPVSLKLLSPNTPIHGSFTNLVDYLFIRGGAGVPSIKYLIGRKNSEGDDVSELAIWDFIISRENFVAVMTESKNGNLLGKAAAALQQHIQSWQDSPEWRLQMFKILQEAPGYTKNKGMFYKNLDAEGTFDAKAGSPADPKIKQAQFKRRTDIQGVGYWARDQAREDAAAGQPNFEAFVKQNDLQDQDQKTLRSLKTIYDKAYKAEIATQPVAESYFGSFHEREKTLMAEEQALMEGGKEGGSQWSISATEMYKMDTLIEGKYYGILDLSDKNIKACADIYIKKLKGDTMTLLETTKEFTTNIGKYFSADRRSTAMTANQKAQEEGAQVVNLLAADVVTQPDDTDI